MAPGLHHSHGQSGNKTYRMGGQHSGVRERCCPWAGAGFSGVLSGRVGVGRERKGQGRLWEGSSEVTAAPRGAAELGGTPGEGSVCGVYVVLASPGPQGCTLRKSSQLSVCLLLSFSCLSL